MARNLKPDYINKIRKTAAPNGYAFDIGNYLYNPSYDYDYPSFIKTVAEDEKTETVRRVSYFKHYDGSGEYTLEVYTRPKSSGWAVCKTLEEKVLEQSNRFNLKKLLTFCV